MNLAVHNMVSQFNINTSNTVNFANYSNEEIEKYTGKQENIKIEMKCRIFTRQNIVIFKLWLQTCASNLGCIE